MDNESRIFDHVKRTGWIDLHSGVRLASREYLQRRVIEVSPGHQATVSDSSIFDDAPYWLFIEPEGRCGKVRLYSVREEGYAIAITPCGNLPCKVYRV